MNVSIVKKKNESKKSAAYGGITATKPLTIKSLRGRTVSKGRF
jgi:hypothetical protein